MAHQETLNATAAPATAEPVTHTQTTHHDVADNRKTAIWLFLASEIMFFTVLIGTYMLARWKNPGPHDVLNIPLTGVNTFILLTSSLWVVRSLSAIQQGNRKGFLRFTALSILFGATFVSVQAFEYTRLYSEGLTLNSSLFGSAFFTLTGFHGAHVIIGVIWLIRLFVRGLNGAYSPGDNWGVEMAGLYWHFVDVIWIVLFTLIYLI